MNAALLSSILICSGLAFILAMIALALYLRKQQVQDSLSKTQRLADPTFSGQIRQQVVDLLAQEKKIEAIKLYRQTTGVSLKEAMEAVEKIARSL